MIIGGQSHKGQERERNEDRYYYKLLPDIAVLAVADGMGGHAAGEVASSIAVGVIDLFLERINTAVMSNRFLLNTVEEIIREANRRIRSAAVKDTDKEGMGTTLTLGLLRGNDLYVGHVGDSRAYIIADNYIRQITSDHTVVEDMIRYGKITRAEAKIHRQRHMLTRSLGSRPYVKIDLNAHELENGEAVLFCSDGLTLHVGDDEIKDYVNSAKDNPQEVANKLVDLANDRGGIDNITAVLLVRPRGQNV